MPYLLTSDIVDFKDRTLLFIDFELSGLDSERHEIIEVAALKVASDSLEIVNSYYTKVIPSNLKTADSKSLQVAGYTPSAWKNAIPLRNVLIELSQLAPDCVLAGWAVHTEFEFLNAALKKEHLPHFYHHHLLEIWTLAYVYFRCAPQIKHLGLSKVSQTLGVKLDPHKPESDIRATYEIFCRLTNLSQTPRPS